MQQSNFSTPESVSLEKEVNLRGQHKAVKSEDLERLYEVERCAKWIQSNQYQRVCLQFPDYLLVDATEVALKLESILLQTVYVLGDTAYESCCIDYIAAAHIDADAIIHFGPTCLSTPSANIPYLYIYEKYDLNVEKLKCEVCERLKQMCDLTLLIDTPYIHLLDDIVNSFKGVMVETLDKPVTTVPKSRQLVFVGNNERKLFNLELALQPTELFYFDGTLQKYQISQRVLNKRNYLVEKIKDSNTIGIIVGTLGVQNYLKVIERLKKLIRLNGKKYYLISIGKPTVAKLANFPELDIYVVVTCSQSEIFDSRDFYKPIATPYDVEIALNANIKTELKFSYDFNQYLGNAWNENIHASVQNEADVSLLTNKVRISEPEKTNCTTSRDGNQVAVRSDGTLSLNTSYGAGYLADRTWKGLEQNLGQAEAELAQEGNRGLARKYFNEKL